MKKLFDGVEVEVLKIYPVGFDTIVYHCKHEGSEYGEVVKNGKEVASFEWCPSCAFATALQISNGGSYVK